MMATRFKYAIHQAGKSFGVESVSKLHDLACRRKLGPEDFVFDYVRRTWVRADAIVELQPIFAAHREIDSLSAPSASRPPGGDLSAPELSNSELNAFVRMTVPRTAQEKETTAISKAPPRPAAPSMTQNRLDLNQLFGDLEIEPSLHNGSGYRVTHTRDDLRVGLSEKVQEEALRRFSEPVRSSTQPEPPAAEPPPERFSRGSARSLFWATVAVLVALLVAATAFRAGVALYGAGDTVYVTRAQAGESLPIRNVTP